MAIFRKPRDLSYDKIIEYVQKCEYEDDHKMFEYLYFLCDRYAKDKGYFSNKVQYEKFGIVAAGELFDYYLKNGYSDYDKILDKISYAIRLELNYDNNVLLDNEGNNENALSNHLTEILFSNKGPFRFSLTEVPSFVDWFLNTLPARQNSSESHCVKVSIKLSFLKLLSTIPPKQLLDLYVFPEIPVVLYHTDEKYRQYIKSVVNQLLCHLRDNFNRIMYSKIETQEIIRLRELLNEE